MTWKANCDADCGHENIKYVTLREEPGRGSRLKYGTPSCGAAPAGALIVESVPDNTATYSSCTSGTDAGRFDFTFHPNPAANGPGLGPYEAKETCTRSAVGTAATSGTHTPATPLTSAVPETG